jgi:catechol-2,3-dioxygenase
MRIREVHLPSHDLERQHQFYTKALGFLAYRPNPETLEIQIGASLLTLHASEHSGVGSYHFAMNIPPSGYEQALGWIGERVPLISNAEGSPVVYFENWNAHALYFDDPEGNSLELIARHTLDTDRVGFQGIEDILCISEISCATLDIEKEVAKIERETGESVYKNTHSADFAAVGTEEGLIICAKYGRLWFMNPGRMAQECPTRISVETTAGAKRLLAW